MKKKSLIIGVLIALFSLGIISEAGAHRWGCRGYGYGYGFRPRRVWIAPPPVVVYGPSYGYYHRPYYNPAPRYGYYGRPHYGYRRW